MAEPQIIGLTSPEQAQDRPAPTGFESEDTLHDAVRDLITTYHDLNPTAIDELHHEPSPLEFMRYVARNRPFVVRKGAAHWDAHRKWGYEYLKNTLGDSPVNVATTPSGNADSVLHLSDARALFAKPFEHVEPFSAAMESIRSQEQAARRLRDQPHPQRDAVHYLQTQNDNLRGEYATLFADVPATIPWARIALAQDPDAVNFWLGNTRSSTALHKDNYENVYVQVLGKKHFVLLPPVEAPCVNERAVLSATYQGPSGAEISVDAGDDGEPVYVPFATWDPDTPEDHATPFSRYSRPLRVSLEPGDMLYLPALWYHKVGQSCGDDLLCVAVNYWYDLDFSGGFWAANNFVRGVGLLAQQQQQQQTPTRPSEGLEGLGVEQQAPQPMSQAEKGAMMENWVREWQQAGLHDQGPPQPMSNAEKSGMMDSWVRQWQRQGQASTPPSQRLPQSNNPAPPQPMSDAEKSSMMDRWVQEWAAAHK